VTEKELMKFVIERSNDPIIKNPVLRDAMNKDLGPRNMYNQGSSVDHAVRTIDPVQDSGNKIEEVLKAYGIYQGNRKGGRMSFKKFFELFATENFATGGSAGQLVSNTVDGSRPGYSGTNPETGEGFQKGHKLSTGKDLKGKPSLNVEGKNQYTPRTTEEIQTIIDANPELQTPKNFYEPKDPSKKLLTFTDTQNSDVVFKRRGYPDPDPSKQKKRDVKRKKRLSITQGGKEFRGNEMFNFHHIMPIGGETDLTNKDVAIIDKHMNGKLSKYNRPLNDIADEISDLYNDRPKDYLKKIDNLHTKAESIINTVKKDLPKKYQGLIGFTKLEPVFDENGTVFRLQTNRIGVDDAKSIGGKKEPIIKLGNMDKDQTKIFNLKKNKLIEEIAKKNPKVAKKIVTQFNSGIPVDDIMRELSKVPGMNKLARGFTKVGGPFEAGIAALDFINNLDSMDADEAFKTSLSNVTFGAYKGDKKEQMETLNDAAGELGYKNEGFNELKEVIDLQKLLKSEQQLLADMQNYNKTDKTGLQGNFEDLDLRKDFVIRLEKELDSKMNSLYARENFDEIANNYEQTVDYVARKQYNKNIDREDKSIFGERKDRVNPDMNFIGDGLWQAVTDPATFLPQNFLQNEFTKGIPNALRKLPGVGKYFDPTSERAKLFDMSEEDKIKRAEGLNAVRQNYHPVMGNSMNYDQMEPFYDKYYAQGGLASLKRKL